MQLNLRSSSRAEMAASAATSMCYWILIMQSTTVGSNWRSLEVKRCLYLKVKNYGQGWKFIRQRSLKDIMENAILAKLWFYRTLAWCRRPTFRGQVHLAISEVLAKKRVLQLQLGTNLKSWWWCIENHRFWYICFGTVYSTDNLGA